MNWTMVFSGFIITSARRPESTSGLVFHHQFDVEKYKKTSKTSKNTLWMIGC
jgi:hypothetical protein